MFDIKGFNPSIQKELVSTGVRFTLKFIDITSKYMEII